MALDWGAAATMTALGSPPLGVPVPSWYGRVVVDPPLPSTTVDVGLLNAPNFELLETLAPRLILIPPGLRPMEGQLRRIAEVETVAFATAASDGLPAVAAETLRLGGLLGLDRAAERLVSGTLGQLEENRAAMASLARPSVLLGSIVDDRHVLVFGTSSLAGQVADSLDLPNAGQALVPAGAEQAIAGWQSIAGLAVERFVGIATDARSLPALQADDPLLGALPFLRQGRAIWIPPVFQGGGLPATARLSRLLRMALSGTPPENG